MDEPREHAAPVLNGFDHSTDRALLADPYREWVRLQAEMRAFRSDISNDLGYDLWYLLRYEDIHAAFHDPGRFSSQTVQYLGESTQRMIPEELDPPEHTKYRQILSRPLSPGNVGRLEGAIRGLAGALVDDIENRGECDLLYDFALKLPTTIFLSIMGLPVEGVDELVGLAQVVLHTTDNHDPDQRLRGDAVLEIIGHLALHLDRRRGRPSHDLLSQMLVATIDGRPLSDEDLLAMGFLLYLAGLDTVANVLAYAMRHLAEHPDLRADLCARDDPWPDAIEEFLRLYSIATSARVVTKDTEFAGCPMKAGDRIVLPTAAAGRDPGQFHNADDFLAGRNPNRHLAFGGGPHRCVGAHLARLELKVALEEWHRRLPHYQIRAGTHLTEHVGAVAGLDRLPLVW